ncbi:MAG: AI-2E family transporter [Pseudomonadota bacterium]
MPDHSPAPHVEPLVRAAWLIAAVAIGSVLVLGRDVLVPMAIAVIVWSLVNGLASTVIAAGRRLAADAPALPRPIAQVVAVSIVAWAGWVIVDIVVDNVGRIVDAAPGYRNALDRSLPLFAAKLGIDRPTLFEDVAAKVPLGDVVRRLASGFTDVAQTAALVLVYVVFLLLEQRRFDQKLDLLYTTPDGATAARAALADLQARIETYVRVKTATSLLTGGTSWLVLWLFGVDFAAFWALIIFLLNYIPTIGSLVGVVFPTLLTLAQFGEPATTVAVGALLGTIQILIGNVIEPPLMGSSLNLSPFVVMASLATWGTMWGVAGMFLCVPLTMILVMVLARFPTSRPLAVLLSQNGRLD